MKTKKSLFSILLSLVLVFTTVFAVSTPVFAASKAEKKEAVTAKLKNDYKTIKGYGTEYKYKSIKVSYGKFASGSTVKRSSTITMKNSTYKITIKETATYNTSKNKATAKYAMKCTKGGKVVKESTVSKLSSVKSFLKKYKKSSSGSSNDDLEPYSTTEYWSLKKCEELVEAQTKEVVRYAKELGFKEDDIWVKKMHTQESKSGDIKYSAWRDISLTRNGKTVIVMCNADSAFKGKTVSKKDGINKTSMALVISTNKNGYEIEKGLKATKTRISKM